MVEAGTVNINQVADVIMGQSPPSTVCNTEQDGLPFYQGVTDFGDMFPTPRMYCTEPKRIAEIGDILFSVRAPIARINIANQRCATGRGIAIIRARKDSDQIFLRLALQSISWYWESLEGSGAIFSNAKKEDILNAEIPWGNDEFRKVVTDHISTLEESEIIHSSLNSDIQQIILALFRSWFINFDPVKAKLDGERPYGIDEETTALFPNSFEDSKFGPIPTGWKWGQLGDCISAVGGGTPSTKKEEFWNGKYNWTSPKDLSNSNSIIMQETEKTITEAGLAKISSGLLPKNTVLMSSRAPIGYLALTKIPVAINQGYIAIPPKNSMSPNFMLSWIHYNMPLIEAYSSGAVFPEINKKEFRKLPILIPPTKLIDKFNEKVTSLYDLMETSLNIMNSLKDTKELLLPRLMTGELSSS